MKSIINWLVSRQLRPILANHKTTILGLGLAFPFFVACLNDLSGVLQKLQDIAAGKTSDIDGVVDLVKAAAAAAGFPLELSNPPALDVLALAAATPGTGPFPAPAFAFPALSTAPKDELALKPRPPPPRQAVRKDRDRCSSQHRVADQIVDRQPERRDHDPPHDEQINAPEEPGQR